MSAQKTLGEMDLLARDDLARLVGHRGPAHVSLFVPTHRAGPDTRQDPIRFRNLIGGAADLLAEQGGTCARELDDLLAPARDLAVDQNFWRHQADGLAVFMAPGPLRTIRAPLDLEEAVTVGLRFWLRPLLPPADDWQFLILALSQNTVSLYEATRFTIAELDLGPIPTSMAEVLSHEDPEAQLQVRAGGRRRDVRRAWPRRRGRQAGDRAIPPRRRPRLIEGVGADRRRPLVLAAVGYYLPIYADVTDYPTLVEQAVEGNPEDRSARDLHASAWGLVAPRHEAARRDAAEALRWAEGTRIPSTGRPWRLSWRVAPSMSLTWSHQL